MWKHFSINRALDFLATAFSGPSALAFAPAICLAAFWIGGERALITVALALPFLIAALTALTPKSGPTSDRRGEAGGFLATDTFASEMETFFEASRNTHQESACLIVALDGFAELSDLHGNAAANHLTQQFFSRVLSAIRAGDVTTRLDQNSQKLWCRSTFSSD